MDHNIAIFASGSGSNAENIIRYFKDKKHVHIPLVVSNKPNAYVLERARKLGVETIILPKQEWDNGAKILELMRNHHIDLIVLAGFLLKIPDVILQEYPNKIINIHPSLLPKYGGKGMYGDRVHQAVVDSGETESGITIHYLNEKYDEGEVIFQATCPVNANDTPEMVATKVHELEYNHYPKVIENLLI